MLLRALLLRHAVVLARGGVVLVLVVVAGWVLVLPWDTLVAASPAPPTAFLVAWVTAALGWGR
ncbi:MAG TPA: hypothetical protein VEB22_12775 [Phycisphaerales bacterium]|nr:hypothetical protein [Phycisphaerales bacterium]